MKRLPTMKQLQYLVALADTQHFGRAAARCYITQSTLSAGIRDLESTLGTAVAERTNRQVLLTRAGRQIAERAKAILQQAEDVMEMARAELTPMTGELRLGVIPTIGPFLLPRILPELRERYPGLTIYLREEQTVPLLARLEEGELDVALIALPYDTRDLTVEIVMEDEFLFACNRNHALAGSNEVSPEALESAQLMLLEEGHCLRGHALDVCDRGNSKIRSQFEASSLHTLVQMVAAGIGVTLIPRLAVDAHVTQGTEVTLARVSTPAFRRIGLVWRPTSLRTKEFHLLATALKEYLT